MQFIKYPKVIGNKKDVSYYLSKVSSDAFEMNRFFITEKLDGTNFAIYYDVKTGNTKFAKRNGFLDPDESFYDYQKFFTKEWVEDFIFKMKDIILFITNNKTHNLPLSYIIFRGEYFGAGIQKRIDYGDKQFNVFDVEVVYSDGENVESMYLPFDVLYEKIPDFLLVPVLCVVDDINDAFSFEVENLKSLKSSNGDIAEGVVIKPSPGIYFGGKQLMFKVKNDKFKEKKSKPKRQQILIEDDLLLKERVAEFVNENRFLSAESKEGKFETSSQMGKFIKVMSKDIIDDIVKEDWYKTLSKKEQKRVFKEVSRQVAAFLKDKMFM